MNYIANPLRYDKMVYNRCGKSGLKLPAVSLGLWKNFGHDCNLDNMALMLQTAFDLGITHFDLANNYGNPAGSAETNFGAIFNKSFKPYRDEIIISTKAGYDMWEGPYGCLNGSRKYIVASLDQSLTRMGLDYVDIYYHHTPDDKTPLEETLLALDHCVRQGKALYVGVSNYGTELTARTIKILRELKTPFILNQVSYSMLNRWIETEKLTDLASAEGLGLIAYSPLAQGILTDRYFNGIPADSRIGKGEGQWMRSPDEMMISKMKNLSAIAAARGQTLSQMALSWVLRDKVVSSVIIGASRPEQILENVEAIEKTAFSSAELLEINKILAE